MRGGRRACVLSDRACVTCGRVSRVGPCGHGLPGGAAGLWMLISEQAVSPVSGSRLWLLVDGPNNGYSSAGGRLGDVSAGSGPVTEHHQVLLAAAGTVPE